MAAMTRTAVEVRRLQEQTALTALRARQTEFEASRGMADRLADRHDAVLQAWTDAAARVHVATLGLWRAEAEASGHRLAAGRRDLQAAEAALKEDRNRWDGQRRRVEAAETVARRAVRDLRRAEEERGLREAEDRHSTRRRRPE